jgi:hypothetical protein
LIAGAPGWLEHSAARLADIGVSAVGVAVGEPWSAWLPGCRSAIVFGSGGRALWDALVSAIALDASWLTATNHPVDDFVRDALVAADPDPPPTRRWVRCADDVLDAPDFRALAFQAGLGHRSKLGLLLHREFGPWLGLRAVCFATDAIPPTGPLSGPSPCEGCAAPCIAACPGGAMSARGWDVAACSRFHVESPVCRGPCASRDACPVGAAHRYSPLQHRYHADRTSGRKALAAELGIIDAGSTPDPQWAGWVGPPRRANGRGSRGGSGPASS